MPGCYDRRLQPPPVPQPHEVKLRDDLHDVKPWGTDQGSTLRPEVDHFTFKMLSNSAVDFGMDEFDYDDDGAGQDSTQFGGSQDSFIDVVKKAMERARASTCPLPPGLCNAGPVTKITSATAD